MSREILFRGKTESGEWTEGFYYCKPIISGYEHVITNYEELKRHTGISTIEYRMHYNEVIPETVGEFTGLYNGAEQKIFEDDIVRFEGELYRVRREDETPGGYWASTAYILQHIGWDDYMSFVDTIDDYSNEICIEIVGNIHDNPELLKGGK